MFYGVCAGPGSMQRPGAMAYCDHFNSGPALFYRCFAECVPGGAGETIHLFTTYIVICFCFAVCALPVIVYTCAVYIQGTGIRKPA